MPAEKIFKHNAYWPLEATPLAIEMACIRLGGKWFKDDRECGEGLEFHYNAMREILWPHLDNHRWVELCLHEATKSKITVLMGAGSTGKTHFAAWWALCDYYCFPQHTCVLVSSTDLRGLELRVWGEIKSLHSFATDRFDLPGHLIDSKHAISTDVIDESGSIRDLRKGIIGIPCVQNGKFVGLGKYCFPAGTPVDTPSGPVSIDKLKVGQLVHTAIGPNRVRALSNHIAPRLVRVTLNNGRFFDCTPDHPILTSSGWVNAIDISPHQRLFSRHETMQIVREGAPETQIQVLLKGMPAANVEEKLRLVRQRVYPFRGQGNFLFEVLLSEMEALTPGYCKADDCRKGFGSGWQEDKPSNPIFTEGNPKAEGSRKEDIPPTQNQTIIQHLGSNQGRIGYLESFSGGTIRVHNPYRRKLEAPYGTLLQAGCLLAGSEDRCRAGRATSQGSLAAKKGFGKRPVHEETWVESVKVLESRRKVFPPGSEEGYRVFNIEVEGHPTYSVQGVIVHNCGIKQSRMRLVADEAQFMGAGFLNAFANLDKNADFKALVLGNPNDILDPLGRAAEPKDGWSSHMEPEKTAVWDTRFMSGRCVNLIGTDSPNFDEPKGTPAKYPYLISRDKIANTKEFFGGESPEFYSQCIGAMKIGAMVKRVLTRDLCTQFHANSRDLVWDGFPTKICALDAAYGGDRCICGYIEFGKDTLNRTRLLIHKPVIVPIMGGGRDPEDQIALFVKEYCKRIGIPPENFFHDSTGRGSLGTSLARIWSAQCNPVEFGGAPTTRPVSLEHYVWDEKEHRRRLKTCREHYSKFVTELWFSFRYAVEADQVRGLPESVMDEFCMREWTKVKGDKIEVEKKEDMKERVGRSPDEADWAAIATEGARRRGFQISRLTNAEAEERNREWLRDLQRGATTLKSGQLSYR